MSKTGSSQSFTIAIRVSGALALQLGHQLHVAGEVDFRLIGWLNGARDRL